MTVGLLERIAAARGGISKRSSIDQWLSEYLIPAATQFTFGGAAYGVNGVNQTWAMNRVREVSQTLPGYMAALRTCPPAFAAQMVRALVLSQARFTFRNTTASPTPRRTFGNRDLGILERPWTNATTGELLSRMEWHAGLAGVSYVYRQPDRLRVLRPDWVVLVYGSQQEPEDAAHALDGELLGYVYQNGGLTSQNRPQTILPADMACWTPLPDPERAGMGMSWLTPGIREIQGDTAATEHKLKFFANGATPNMVVKGIPAMSKEQFDEIVDAMEERHTGVANAYRTLYLTAGADVTVVGANLKELDFKQTQGAGETRLAFLSRVPAPILGIAEGLAGSSLNAGNFGMARRIFADTWVYPALADVAAALAPLVRVPNDAELWFDTADMPLLAEDAKDAADIAAVQGSTIVSLTNTGYDPKTVVPAVISGDMSLLRHTGMLSVQLQAPGALTAPTPQLALPAAPAADPASARAAVNDHNQLKHYWTRDPEGLAKWAEMPHPWTSLYHHLLKYLPPDEAKRTAAQWFHDVKGYWPGDQKGKNPVGPG